MKNIIAGLAVILSFVGIAQAQKTPTVGEDVAAYLAETKFAGLVVIHSTNPFGADLIKKLLSDAGVVHEIVPFGMFGIFRSRNTSTATT